MGKKNWTEEERKAFGQKMKEARQKNENAKAETPRPQESQASQAVEPQEDQEDHIAQEQGTDEILRQIKELQESNALLKAALLNSPQVSNQTLTTSVSMNRNGELIGEFEKYILDKANYPDPTPRLMQEPRLKPLAFDYNYELDYEVGQSKYQTQSGKHIIEPKFHVTLHRIVLDDQGKQTGKRYIARKLIFHEDPDAAMVIARDNGIEVDKTNEREFLNEMRYLRVRDWLFDIFWQKPADEKAQVKEQVIGGQLVQVWEKSSVDPSDIQFDQLRTKVR